MAWQQNKKLAKLYNDITEVNNQRKNDNKTLENALELNSIHHQMIQDMHKEVESLKIKLESFKKEMSKNAYTSLKNDMEKYANILAMDKLQSAVNYYLEEHLESIIRDILKSKGIQLL